MSKTRGQPARPARAGLLPGFTDQEGSVPVTRGGFGGYQEDDPAFSTYQDWPKK